MTADKPVLLWVGDGPDMSTGFGNELRQLIEYLDDYNHIVVDIYQQKFYMEHDKYKSFSFGRLRDEKYSVFKNIPYDAILTFGGLWLVGDVKTYLKKYRPDAKWISVLRVDNKPLFKQDVKILRSDIDETVVPSVWLEKELNKQMIKCVRIPEGISLDVFRKLSDEKRTEIRRPFGGKLVYGCTHRNIFPRKFYDKLLEAFAIFSSNRDDVVLLLHTDPLDKEGYPLGYLVDSYGLKDKVFFSSIRWDVGTGLEDLVETYNQIDVFTSTSGGEAFGRCYLEAMACGCNVIAPKHTSYDELVKGHGLGVDTYASFFLPRLYYHLNIPDVPSLVAKMTEYYEHPELREKHRGLGREFVKGYKTEDSMEQWKKFLGNVLG